MKVGHFFVIVTQLFLITISQLCSTTISSPIAMIRNQNRTFYNRLHFALGIAASYHVARIARPKGTPKRKASAVKPRLSINLEWKPLNQSCLNKKSRVSELCFVPGAGPDSYRDEPALYLTNNFSIISGYFNKFLR